MTRQRREKKIDRKNAVSKHNGEFLCRTCTNRLLLVSRWLNKFYCSSHVRQLLTPDGGKWEMNIQKKKITDVRPFVRFLQTEQKIRYSMLSNAVYIWQPIGRRKRNMLVWNFSQFCSVDGCIYSFRTKLSMKLWRSDFSRNSIRVWCLGPLVCSCHPTAFMNRFVYDGDLTKLLHASTSNYFSIDVNK